ncbi:Tetratricopeptide (TPR) repeat protein, partial [Methanophagales archaeon]
KVSIAAFRPERAYELIYSDNFREYEELFNDVEMLMDKSTGAPFYIRHAISEFEGRIMGLRDIEKLPRGVENLVMMTVESFLKGDDSDKNFIKVLIAISKLRDFSYDFYEAICGEIGEDEERRNAFERFLLRGDYRRYALLSYWKESVDKAIERNIENMELVGKFKDANEDLPSVEEFLRTKLMDWINKASNNRKKLCGLLADAARNAPILGVDLLYFANKHFEKERGEKECDFTRIILAGEFFYLGYALYESEKFNESIKALDISLSLNPVAEAYYNRGIAYAGLSQHERAIEDYSKAIELNLNLAEAYYNRGTAYAELNQHKWAIEDYSKAIELNPNYAKAYTNRGTAYDELNQHERAIEDYNKAIELNPNYAMFYNNRGAAYTGLKKLEQAIEDFNKAIELNLDYAEAYYNRGAAYAGLKKLEQAIEDFNKATELNPNLAGAYNNRGLSYAGLNQHGRAIEDYNKAIELNPNLVEAYYNRGTAYDELKQHERAIKDYNKAIELNPNLVEAYYNRGSTYYGLSQQERAIEDYNKAIELNPSYAEAYGNRGIAHSEIGRYEESALDSKNAGVLFLSSEREDDSVKAFSFCFDLREEIGSDDVLYSGLALFLITKDANIGDELRKMQTQDKTLRTILELTLMKLHGEDISDETAMLEEKDERKEIKILLELLRNL